MTRPRLVSYHEVSNSENSKRFQRHAENSKHSLPLLVHCSNL
jgi:hypothetical protein